MLLATLLKFLADALHDNATTDILSSIDIYGSSILIITSHILQWRDTVRA